MPERMPGWIRAARPVALIVLAAILLTACNLGSPVPSEGITLTAPVVRPQDIGQPPTATLTPLIVLPATATPTPPLLPAEQLGPITIDGTTHRTQEPVTVRVRRGKSIQTFSCSWTLDTGQPTLLATPTSTQLDENTFEDVYTFTPQAAGTYQVNCTGLAQTVSGLRAVSAAGIPFAVEAKG